MIRMADVSICETAGARPVHLAIVGGWLADHHAGAARLFARRDRLADAAAHVASTSCGLSAILLILSIHIGPHLC